MCNSSFNNKTIIWNFKDQIFKTIIYFCNKDYYAEMIEPYRVFFSGSHLMAMNPMTYIAVDENKYINENQQQEEQTKYRTKNIVPIIKKDCERWFENREFNINTERFAISFSNEALKQININDLIEKKSLINKNKKLQKSLIKFGEISQKDYQLFLNNTRKIINEIDKEIVLRGETYVSEHYSNILQNNTFNDIEKPKFWSSKSCLEDGKIDGALISKNMIVKGLKKKFN